MSDRLAIYGFHFVMPSIIGVWGMNSLAFRHWYWFALLWAALVLVPPISTGFTSSNAWTWREHRGLIFEIAGFSVCYAIGSWLVLGALDKWYPIAG